MADSAAVVPAAGAVPGCFPAGPSGKVLKRALVPEYGKRERLLRGLTKMGPLARSHSHLVNIPG